MTDKRIKFGCPFCCTDKKEIQMKTYGNLVRVECPLCGALFQGSSKQEVINKWNCRG